MNLNLKKAIEEIRLDDSPESPVYTLDFTDMGINGKADRMRGCLARFAAAQEAMAEGRSGEVAEAFREVVECMLGEQAYAEIVDYVGAGEVPPEDMTAVMLPLVVYLVDRYGDVLTANDSKVVAQYMRDEVGNAAL